MSKPDNNQALADRGLRVDRWLWAARFFRTRQLATEAVTGGKVHVDGTRAKPGRRVRPGNLLRIQRAGDLMVVRVLGLSGRRGPASEACLLYEEIEVQRRQADTTSAIPHREAPAGRPGKRDRRALRRLRGRDPY
jgi:ribosome-associated heat shock protein Hsp15